jgi:hypothetical protein
LDAGVVDRLERRGAQSGLNKSRLAERYIDERISRNGEDADMAERRWREQSLTR